MTASLTTQREERLPRWARDELDKLRRRVLTLETALGEIPAAEATAWVDRYTDPRPVGYRHDRITFSSDPDTRLPWIDVRLLGETESTVEVEIMASGPLTIAPQVTNVVRLEARR